MYLHIQIHAILELAAHLNLIQNRRTHRWIISRERIDMKCSDIEGAVGLQTNPTPIMSNQ
jgi:hypothetical protein